MHGQQLRNTDTFHFVIVAKKCDVHSAQRNDWSERWDGLMHCPV
jgi:hypothetical protein